MIDAHHPWNKRTAPLIVGLFLSLLFTLSAYALTSDLPLAKMLLTWAIVALALSQALLQLLFFLHLGVDPKERWSMLMFLFMVVLVVVLVGGSLWIMANLNYNMMPER